MRRGLRDCIGVVDSGCVDATDRVALVHRLLRLHLGEQLHDGLVVFGGGSSHSVHGSCDSLDLHVQVLEDPLELVQVFGDA